jgi:hypothetical protein
VGTRDVVNTAGSLFGAAGRRLVSIVTGNVAGRGRRGAGPADVARPDA